MKLITLILLFLSSTFSYAEKIEFGYFDIMNISGGQSGCWYYYPANEKQSGKLVGLGKSAENAIYLNINGEQKIIGNWKADYQKTHHNISYSSPEYIVTIHSKVLSESQYSSQYKSILTVISDSSKTEIEVFGECGS